MPTPTPSPTPTPAPAGLKVSRDYILTGPITTGILAYAVEIVKLDKKGKMTSEVHDETFNLTPTDTAINKDLKTVFNPIQLNPKEHYLVRVAEIDAAGKRGPLKPVDMSAFKTTPKWYIRCGNTAIGLLKKPWLWLVFVTVVLVLVAASNTSSIKKWASSTKHETVRSTTVEKAETTETKEGSVEKHSSAAPLRALEKKKVEHEESLDADSADSPQVSVNNHNGGVINIYTRSVTVRNAIQRDSKKPAPRPEKVEPQTNEWPGKATPDSIEEITPKADGCNCTEQTFPVKILPGKDVQFNMPAGWNFIPEFVTTNPDSYKCVYTRDFGSHPVWINSIGQTCFSSEPSYSEIKAYRVKNCSDKDLEVIFHLAPRPH